MTRQELKTSHDRMAKFILQILHHSDTVWKGKREPDVQEQYDKALRLVRAAGFEYRGVKSGNTTQLSAKTSRRERHT